MSGDSVWSYCTCNSTSVEESLRRDKQGRTS